MSNTAKHLYSEGCRAGGSIDDFWLQWPNDRRQYPTSIQLWEELRAYEISVTWKERHAKGMPVEMTFDEWSDCVDTLPPDFKPKNGFYYGLRGPGPGTPYISIKNKEIGTYARFCNFRYKPEWIEKKGGLNV